MRSRRICFLSSALFAVLFVLFVMLMARSRGA